MDGDGKAEKEAPVAPAAVTWLVLLTVAAGAFALFVLPTWQAEATTTYVKYTASRGTISNALSFSGLGERGE